MAPIVKNGKIVAGTPAPSTGGTAAAGRSAASGASNQKREAAPPPPPPPPQETTQTAAPVEETPPTPMASPAGSEASQFAREKREALLAARSTPSQLREAADTAKLAALSMAAATPVGQMVMPMAAAYKAVASSPETGTYAVGKLASAARAAQEEFGSDLGLTRVAQLAREYLPQARQAEYQTESPRPGSYAAQSGRERIFVPQNVPDATPRDLSSVAAFRTFYETKVENLADMRRRLAEKDAQIRLAPDTATDEDMKKLAQERAQIKQYETDYRASLLRAGFSDPEINAMVRGETPTTR